MHMVYGETCVRLNAFKQLHVSSNQSCRLTKMHFDHKDALTCANRDTLT